MLFTTPSPSPTHQSPLQTSTTSTHFSPLQVADSTQSCLHSAEYSPQYYTFPPSPFSRRPPSPFTTHAEHASQSVLTSHKQLANRCRTRQAKRSSSLIIPPLQPRLQFPSRIFLLDNPPHMRRTHGSQSTATVTALNEPPANIQPRRRRQLNSPQLNTSIQLPLSATIKNHIQKHPQDYSFTTLYTCVSSNNTTPTGNMGWNPKHRSSLSYSPATGRLLMNSTIPGCCVVGVFGISATAGYLI